MIPKFRFYSKRMNKIGIVISLHPLRNRVYVEWDDTLSGTEDINDNGALMQSTGLFDKNCKEIFEGDILKCTSFDGSLWYETVSWDSTLAGFATQQDGYDATAISYTTDSKAITIEIIGNLHQNPELVEAEND